MDFQMRELLHAPSLVSFEKGAGSGGENYLLMLQISSRSNFFKQVWTTPLLNANYWKLIFIVLLLTPQIVLGDECPLSVLCKARLCLCTGFILVAERRVICIKPFPLLPYSEPPCPPAMSDGRITVPGRCQMKGIQASCGQPPNRGTRKYLFPGWEQRGSSPFLCQLVEHTQLLQFSFRDFPFVTNLLSIARKKLYRDHLLTLSY